MTPSDVIVIYSNTTYSLSGGGIECYGCDTWIYPGATTVITLRVSGACSRDTYADVIVNYTDETGASGASRDSVRLK